MVDDHSNLSHLGRLVEKRPDLRIIVNMTPSHTFKDKMASKVFQELMDKSLSPKHSLSQLFFSDSPKDFFAYSSPEEGGSYFREYLVEYLQMRRGK